MCGKLLRNSALLTSLRGFQESWRCQLRSSEHVCCFFATSDGQSSRARYCILPATLCFWLERCIQFPILRLRLHVDIVGTVAGFFSCSGNFTTFNSAPGDLHVHPAKKCEGKIQKTFGGSVGAHHIYLKKLIRWT